MEKTTRAATTRDSEKYIVRFPDGMRDRIAEAAKANGRSMNAEIVSRLEGSFRSVDVDNAAAILLENNVFQATIDAYKVGADTLHQLNRALALALEELATHVPKESMVPAAETAVRMAQALVRNDQLAVYRNAVVASRPDSDQVVYLDLTQNIAQLIKPTVEAPVPAAPKQPSVERLRAPKKPPASKK